MLASAQERDTVFFQVPCPPLQGISPRDTQGNSINHPGTRNVAHDMRPIEKGYVGPWIAKLIGIEEMIGRNIVLVHRLFDEAQTQYSGVKIDISSSVSCDGGHMMNAC